MKKRIITAIVALCVFVPILIFANTPALPIGLAFCSILAVYEMLGCTGLRRSVAVSIPFYLCAAAIPFIIRYCPEYLFKIAVSATLLTVLYLFAVLIFSKGKYTIPDISVSFFGIFHALVGFCAIIYVHDLVDGGAYVYLIAFIGAWVTDTFAYFCGMLFGRGGKHKLIPEVSPKKTVEGSIGGIVFCVLAMILFGFIIEKIDSAFHANYLLLAIGGLAISIVAQIGDLSMSVIKRHYGIKDYGFIFPGHGGILDRFDSVIAVSVVLAVFTTFFRLFEVI